MKLAIYKEESLVPEHFHYFLHPNEMLTDNECAVYESLGNTIIEVDDAFGIKLLEQARAALNHQIQISILLDKAEKEIKK